MLLQQLCAAQKPVHSLVMEKANVPIICNIWLLISEKQDKLWFNSVKKLIKQACEPVDGKHRALSRD